MTVGRGKTVIVKVLGAPLQVTPALVKTGVTMIIATCVVLPLLIVRKDGILPLPLAPRPMEVLLFVQLKTVPGTVEVKFTALVKLPLQTS